MDRHRLFALICVCALCLIQTVGGYGVPKRDLKQTNEQEITSRNVQRLSEFVEDARENTLFIISSDIRLPSTIVVNSDRVRFRGVAGRRPTIRCAKGLKGFIVRGDRIRFENLIIRGCKNTAVDVTQEIVEEEEEEVLDDDYDPFDDESVAERQRQIAEQENQPPPEPLPERNVSITFRDVEFIGNAASSGKDATGGGITFSDRIDATIINCSFMKNTGNSGAAIFFAGNALMVENSTFSDNLAEDSGGAIHAVRQFLPDTSRGDRSIQINITGCTFTGNEGLRGREDPTELTGVRNSKIESTVHLRLHLPAPSGGAIFIADYSLVTILQSNFQRNKAVPAGGAIFLGNNGEITIRRCRFNNNSLGEPEPLSANSKDLMQGGAVFVAFDREDSELSVEWSQFQNNEATYGGAIHYVAPLAGVLKFDHCDFHKNRASLGGGAIVIRNINSALFRSSVFTDNKAFVGGAVFATNGAGLTFQEAADRNRKNRFNGNEAYDGGAVFTMGGGEIQLSKVQFHRNRAERNGGAICSIDAKAGSNFGFAVARMSDNSAENGGAMFLENIPSVNFEEGLFDKNRALVGRNQNTRGEMTGNKAVSGGAIYYRASNLVKNVFVVDEVVFENNRVYPDLSMVHREPLEIPNVDRRRRKLFQAKQNAPETEKIVSDPTSPSACQSGGGGAMCIIHSGIPVRAPVTVEISGCDYMGNSARIGGAIVISTAEDINWVDSCPPNDNTQSLLTSDPCRSFSLRNLKFANNRAAEAGGALIVSNLEHVFYSSQESDDGIFDYRPLDEHPERANYQNNTVGGGGYGPDIASVAVRLEVFEPTVNDETGLLISNQAGGVSNQLPEIKVRVIDGLDQIITAGILDSVSSVGVRAFRPGSEEPITTGEVVSTAKAGVAKFTALALNAPPSTYFLTFFLQIREAEVGNQTVQLRNCRLGEQYNSESFVCGACPADTFTFFSDVRNCETCLIHAKCTGNASLVPANKYWHSSPFSLILHECIQEEACSYADRSDTINTYRNNELEDFFDRFKHNDMPVFTNEEYPQCSRGYDGPLCGSCADGFGHADGKACVECNSRSSTAAVVFLLAVWQLIFLGVTIRSALISIRDMNQLAAIAQQQKHTPAHIAQGAQPSRRRVTQTGNFMVQSQPSHVSQATVEAANEMSGAELELHHAALIRSGTDTSPRPSTHTLPITNPAPAPSPSSLSTNPKQQYSADYIIAAQHVSETIKIFVNFFQVTSVAVNINLHWTTSIKKMLASMNSVAGFSNGATFTPMTCLLDSDANLRAIHGVILRISFPLCLMVLVMSVFCFEWFLKRRSPIMSHADSQRLLRSRLTICFLVVGFFAYQSISEDLLGTVSCISLDSTELNEVERKYDQLENGVNYSQFSIARKRYWIEDTNIECLSSDHVYLVGFLGIPGIILFLFGVPFYLLVFLLYKRYKGELLALHVLNTYGFIYQNYEDRYVAWEVCILIRKALISAIVVFAYPLGANLQGIMGLGVLILALAFHLIAVPFKYVLLNILEGCSLLVSIFTFYAGVVFNDDKTSAAGRVFLSVAIVMINSALFIVFIGTAGIYMDRYVIARLKSMDIQDIPVNPVSRMFLLARILSNQATATLRSRIHQSLYRTQSKRIMRRSTTQQRTQLANTAQGNVISAQPQGIIQPTGPIPTTLISTAAISSSSSGQTQPL